MDNESRAAFSLTRRVGSTNYTVNVRCGESAKNSFEDIILRLIRGEAMEGGSEDGKMTVPQGSRRSNKSAS